MPLLYSKFEGVLQWTGGQVMLKRGQSIDDAHPLAKERADLFDDKDPGASIPDRPVVERATSAPGEVRTTPGTGPRAGARVPKQPGSGQ